VDGFTDQDFEDMEKHAFGDRFAVDAARTENNEIFLRALAFGGAGCGVVAGFLPHEEWAPTAPGLIAVNSSPAKEQQALS
jgi:hypothetical protein